MNACNVEILSREETDPSDNPRRRGETWIDVFQKYIQDIIALINSILEFGEN